MSPIAKVIYRHEQAGRPPRWLEMTRAQASAVKAQQAVESDKRMEVFVEREQERQQALQIEEANRRERDRWTLATGAAVGGVILVMLLLIAIAQVVSR